MKAFMGNVYPCPTTARAPRRTMRKGGAEATNCPMWHISVKRVCEHGNSVQVWSHPLFKDLLTSERKANVIYKVPCPHQKM